VKKSFVIVWSLLLSCGFGQVLLEREEPLRFLRATTLLEIHLEALPQAPALAPRLPQYLALFAGTLETRDPVLLKSLEKGLGEAVALGRRGDGKALAAVVPQLRALVGQAESRLVPRQDALLLAGLLVHLALGDDGVAESYEDFHKGEEEAYIVGFLALRRLENLWSALRPRLPKEAQARGAQALKALRTLYPTPAPPARLVDPEDAERAALDLVSALEGGFGQVLLPREVGPVWLRIQALVEAACRPGVPPRLRMERFLAASGLYKAYLADTLKVLDSRVAEALEGLWARPDCARAPGLLREAGRILGG
jgi:hypothetical protein